MKEVFHALVRFEKLSKEVQDILECRIEAILDEIGNTLLCWLPEEEAATPEEFNIATEKVCQSQTQYLSKYAHCNEIPCNTMNVICLLERYNSLVRNILI